MATHGVMAQVEHIERLEADGQRRKLKLGLALRAKRESLGLSLRDVASAVGVTMQLISMLERGKTGRTKTLRTIAEYYTRLPDA
jgi:DNA-binding XRE family transcriptional regulator